MICVFVIIVNCKVNKEILFVFIINIVFFGFKLVFIKVC